MNILSKGLSEALKIIEKRTPYKFIIKKLQRLLKFFSIYSFN